MFLFLYFNEFFVLKCFTFFYILTYEHGTRKEKIQKTERKTKHYTSQTNTQLGVADSVFSYSGASSYANVVYFVSITLVASWE